MGRTARCLVGSYASRSSARDVTARGFLDSRRRELRAQKLQDGDAHSSRAWGLELAEGAAHRVIAPPVYVIQRFARAMKPRAMTRGP